jgi:hypothetical protein
MRGVRRLLAAVGASVLGLLIGIGALAAGSASPETVTVGNVVVSGDGHFVPKALPRDELAPIAFTISGKVRSKDGAHPPALRELLIETDKNGAIEVKGYPICTAGKLQSTTSNAALATCKPALIGEGTTDAEIEFEEQDPVRVDSKLLVFNGGFRGGVTTLYVHAYITVPVPAAIVTTVKIKKINRGRYGLLSTATIPKIAGGNGSVTDFKLKIERKYSYEGRRVSVLSAKCPDGKLQAHATAIFDDGTRAATEFIRPCTPQG